jgi:hypothetical protein
METDDSCWIESGLMHPATVMVLDGTVFAVYPWGSSPDAHDRDQAHEAAQLVSAPVVVYEVDEALPPPPPPGSHVDPIALQWVEVERIEPLHILPS